MVEKKNADAEARLAKVLRGLKVILDKPSKIPGDYAVVRNDWDESRARETMITHIAGMAGHAMRLSQAGARKFQQRIFEKLL